MEASLQKKVVNHEDLPKDPFTYDSMIQHWQAYADRLSKSGLMLMYSLMGMTQPKLEAHHILLELPNEGSKLSFEENKYELVNYLRRQLNNYDIEIHITVNEEIKIKKVFDSKDKYLHLNEINPNLEVLRRTFDLELK